MDARTNSEQLTRHKPGSRLGVRLGSVLEEDEDGNETPWPGRGLRRDLEQLDRELEQRDHAEIPAQTVDLIAGLVAGMRLVGRPQ